MREGEGERRLRQLLTGSPAPILVSDIDGVLANLVSSIRQWVLARYNVLIATQDITSLHIEYSLRGALMKTGIQLPAEVTEAEDRLRKELAGQCFVNAWFYAGLTPTDLAAVFAAQLYSREVKLDFCLTSRPTTMTNATTEWLARHRIGLGKNYFRGVLFGAASFNDNASKARVLQRQVVATTSAHQPIIYFEDDHSAAMDVVKRDETKRIFVVVVARPWNKLFLAHTLHELNEEQRTRLMRIDEGLLIYILRGGEAVDVARLRTGTDRKD